MNRATSYVIFFLIALVLTILPAAMWPDMAMPIDNWENWFSNGQPSPRRHFSLNDPPPLLRAEITTYKILVTPPAYARRMVRGWPTAYAAFFIPPYRETAGIPPLAMALEHSAWALPLWFAFLVVAFETLRLSLKKQRKKRPSNSV